MSDRATHAAQLREVKQRRLEALEIQAAELGNATPPHITTEMEQIKAGLIALTVAEVPEIQEDVKRVLRRYDQLDLVVQTLAGVVVRLTQQEQRSERDGAERIRRQTVLNAWLALLSLGVFYLIIRSL